MMPSKAASQSSEVGKIDKMSSTIQKIIQMKELAMLSLLWRMERKIYRIINNEIIMKNMLCIFDLSFANVFRNYYDTCIELSNHIFNRFPNAGMHRSAILTCPHFDRNF